MTPSGRKTLAPIEDRQYPLPRESAGPLTRKEFLGKKNTALRGYGSAPQRARSGPGGSAKQPEGALRKGGPLYIKGRILSKRVYKECGKQTAAGESFEEQPKQRKGE